MTDQPTLRQLERRTWLRTFEHGLWDVGIGALFLAFGVSILVGLPAFAGIWVPVALPALRAAGRRWIVPRIGTVKFNERRRRASGRLSAVLFATVGLGLVFFLLISWRAAAVAPGWVDWVALHLAAVLGWTWGAVLIVTGWLVDFPRLYAYGALIALSLSITDIAPGWHFGLSLAAVGTAILLVGIVLLVRFVRRYPRCDVAEEGTDA